MSRARGTKMGIRRKNVTDKQKQTVLRLFEDGLPVEQVVKAVQLNRSTVYKIKHTAEQGKGLRFGLYSRHLERLRESVNQLRIHLHNPNLELEPYIGTGQHLLLGGHDWALVPEEWAELTTPDFSDEALWGDTFPGLRQHLKESPFWKHLDELKEMVSKLTKDLAEAAKRFGETDHGFWKSWQEIQ